MLNDRIRAGHAEERERLAGLGLLRTLVRGARRRAGSAPTLLATTAKELLADPDPLLQECFGPTSIVVEYSGPEELRARRRGVRRQPDRHHPRRGRRRPGRCRR